MDDDDPQMTLFERVGLLVIAALVAALFVAIFNVAELIVSLN